MDTQNNVENIENKIFNVFTGIAEYITNRLNENAFTQVEFIRDNTKEYKGIRFILRETWNKFNNAATFQALKTLAEEICNDIPNVSYKVLEYNSEYYKKQYGIDIFIDKDILYTEKIYNLIALLKMKAII